MASSTRSVPQEIAGGIGAYLAARGLASWDEFGEGTAYDAGADWPVYLGPDMPTSPDRIIVATPGVHRYSGGNLDLSVQLRLRGSRDGAAREVADHLQAIEDAFRPNGFPAAHVALGAVRVGVVRLGDSMPLSPDGNRRHGAITNLRIRARRPGRG